MSTSEIALLVLYYVALAVLVGFAVHRLALAMLVRGRPAALPRRGDDGPPCEAFASPSAPDDALPTVTVQLPLFNEAFVAERLLRHAAALDWPRDRLQIQVLDDSTDGTTAIVERVARELRDQGVDCEVVRRRDRRGYKAGALAHGLSTARGAWIVIFDADFVPPADFLRRVAPHRIAPDIGMVQTRWAHLNRDFSALTAAQATLLDGHFVIEQPARARLGAVFNFNGTAGMWRRTAIEAAGGWQHDTITEDLDLSYRSRLAGSAFIYREDIEAPGEIPAEVHGFRSQQHRWAKGSVECARKLLPLVLAASLPLRHRIEALIHLLANTTYLLLLALAVTLPLTITIRVRHRMEGSLALDAALALTGLGSVLLFYTRSQTRQGVDLHRAVGRALAAIVLDAGLAVHKSRAVLEALVGHRSAFIRTPKFALLSRTDSWLGNRYVRPHLHHGLAELALAAWSAWGIVLALGAPVPVLGPLPFLALFVIGFGWVGALCIVDSLRHTRAALRAGAVGADVAPALAGPPPATHAGIAPRVHGDESARPR